MVHYFNPSTWEAGSLWVQGEPVLHSEFQDNQGCVEILPQKTINDNNNNNLGWKNGSVIKSTGNSYRGPRFDSQNTYGISLQSITPVPGYPAPSSGLCGLCKHRVQRHTCK